MRLSPGIDTGHPAWLMFFAGPLVRDRVQQGIDKVQTSGVLSLSHFQSKDMFMSK